MRERRRVMRRGFTLIELLVVMMIIMVLAGLLFVGVRNANNANYTAVSQQTISRLYVAIEMFDMEYDDFPAEESAPRRITMKTGTVDSNMPSDGGVIKELNQELYASSDSRHKDGVNRFLFDRSYLDDSTTKELLNPWGIPYYYDKDGDNEGPIGNNINGISGFDAVPLADTLDYDNLSGADGNKYTLGSATDTADEKEEVGHATRYVVITADPVARVPLFHKKYAKKK